MTIGAYADKKRRELGLFWWDVVVDDKRQIVKVGDYFYAQGEEATEIIERARSPHLKDRVAVIFYLDSAGVL